MSKASKPLAILILAILGFFLLLLTSISSIVQLLYPNILYDYNVLRFDIIGYILICAYILLKSRNVMMRFIMLFAIVSCCNILTIFEPKEDITYQLRNLQEPKVLFYLNDVRLSHLKEILDMEGQLSLEDSDKFDYAIDLLADGYVDANYYVSVIKPKLEELEVFYNISSKNLLVKYPQLEASEGLFLAEHDSRLYPLPKFYDDNLQFLPVISWLLLISNWFWVMVIILMSCLIVLDPLIFGDKKRRNYEY